MARRNHPMRPVGRVPSNFKLQVYLVASNFCNWLSFLRWAPWQAGQTTIRGEGKMRMGREWVKHGSRWKGRSRKRKGIDTHTT